MLSQKECIPAIEYNINDEDTDKIRNLTERTFELKLNNVKILDKNYMILFDPGKNDEGQLFDYEQYVKDWALL